jgi:hypothetical protein
MFTSMVVDVHHENIHRADLRELVVGAEEPQHLLMA